MTNELDTVERIDQALTAKYGDNYQLSHTKWDGYNVHFKHDVTGMELYVNELTLEIIEL